MKRLGVFLIIFGAGSFILPLFGLQFRLLSLFGNYTSIAAIIAVVVGVVLLIVSSAGKSAQDDQGSTGS